MANEFYTAQQVSDLALRLAESDQFLSALIARDVVNPLKGGGAGRSVELRVPNGLIARDRNVDDKSTVLIYDELKETRITVSANQAAYSGVDLSDGDLSLNLSDFGAQVLVHQVNAVTEKVEGAVAGALNAIPAYDDSEGVIRLDEADPIKTFTDIRKVLRKRGVPETGLQVVVGVDVYAALLDAKAITDASESASTAALREGNVGRIRGFEIVESTRIADDEIVALHRDAFSLTVKPETVPAGAAFGQVVTGRGFGLRYLRGFDMSVAKERSLVSTMYAVVRMPMFKITQDGATQRTTAVQLPAGHDATIRVATGFGTAGA